MKAGERVKCIEAVNELKVGGLYKILETKEHEGKKLLTVQEIGSNYIARWFAPRFVKIYLP